MVDYSVGSSTSTAATTTTTSTAKTDAAKATLDYDNFLQLLITQMKNQDPTDPMDATEQVSQLATFSNVEQSIKMNTNLESLISASSLSNASSYIGKTITSADGNTSGVVASVEVTSDGLTATTVAGSKIAIGEGIKISQTAS
ncbi:flagellar hook assembly protein FlgD [Agrobacterium larrymoorei]|uniref:Basal-body rod modification protein FlgD n=1 Tax=Agrobacterium larrymoorei TaxID=160699 RepID=A0AAF0H9Y7_9HYPH|nr:flagellar hook assembly protein FlgD [Agrobacterium larrymoorei]WHA40815.1 flagellar hook assembly protein FlgD [Agrobacterium larrymoorei]